MNRPDDEFEGVFNAAETEASKKLNRDMERAVVKFAHDLIEESQTLEEEGEGDIGAAVALLPVMCLIHRLVDIGVPLNHLRNALKSLTDSDTFWIAVEMNHSSKSDEDEAVH